MLLSQESLAGVLMVLVGRMVAAVDFPIDYGLCLHLESPSSLSVRAAKMLASV